MKSLPQLLTIILITSLPFLSTAQFSVGVLTAPISTITTTKGLVPIGVELKFAPNKSVVLEYGIPVFDLKDYEYNETAASYSAEFRNYKPTIDKKGFQRYYAVSVRHISEFYALENNSYHTKGNQEISFDYAEINSTINSMSVRFGLQGTLNTKIVVDFNFGIRLNNKNVLYKNVIIAPPSFTSGWNLSFDLDLTPYDYIPSFAQQPDDLAKSHTYINIPISFRVGYLFSR